MFREMLRSSSVYGIGLIAQRVLSLLLLPLYTHYLTPADYGTIELLDLLITVSTVLVGGRMASTLIFFYKRASGPDEQKRALSTAIATSALVGLVAVLAGFLFAEPLTRLVFPDATNAPYTRIMFVTFAFSLQLECCLSWLRAEHRAKRYVVYTLAQLLLAVTLNIVLIVVFRMGFPALVWSGLIVAAASSIPQLIGILRFTGLTVDRSLFKKIVAFAAPVGIVGVSTLIYHSGDRFFLKSSVTLGEIGIYALAYKLGMLVSLLPTSFNNYWGAKQYDLSHETDGALFARTLTYLMLVMTAAAVVLWVFATPMIRIVSAQSYWAAAQYVPCILLAYLIRGAADYLRSVFYIRARPDADAKLNVTCALFFVAAYWLLIPRFRLWGAALATLAGFTVLLVGSYVWARRLFPVHPEWKRLGQMGFAAALSVALYGLLPGNQIWAHLLAAATASLAFPAILAASGFFHPSERAFVMEKLEALGLRRVSAAQIPPGG